MTYEIILAPTTASSTSKTFTLSQDLTSATIICNGLATDETATIQIYEPISKTFIDWIPLSPIGSEVQLTASVNSVTVAEVWGEFQIVKSSTVAAVGISVNQFVSPRI